MAREASQETDVVDRPILPTQDPDVLAGDVAPELILPMRLAYRQPVAVITPIDDDFGHYAQPVPT